MSELHKPERITWYKDEFTGNTMQDRYAKVDAEFAGRQTKQYCLLEIGSSWKDGNWINKAIFTDPSGSGFDEITGSIFDAIHQIYCRTSKIFFSARSVSCFFTFPCHLRGMLWNSSVKGD